MTPSTVCRVTARTALRAAVLTATTALLVLPTTPAFAAAVLAHRDDGDEPGSGLSVLQTLGIYVGIPLALFVGIAVVVAVPGIARGPRYRPGVGWWAAPVWFNGPANPDEAVRDPGDPGDPGRPVPVTTEGGGTSARW
jgi:hypothetical protein